MYLPEHEKYFVTFGTNFSVPCTAFFGNCAETDRNCFIDWLKNEPSMLIPSIDHSGDKRIYTQPSTTRCVKQSNIKFTII
jgi:hypothetical protein